MRDTARRARRTATWVIGLVALAACGDRSASPLEPIVVPKVDTLLSVGRVVALGGAQASSWQGYLAASRAGAEAEHATLDAELRALGRTGWEPAPVAADFALISGMTAAWFQGAEAHRIADDIVSFQTPTGGWSKAVDMTVGPRRPGQSWSSTTSWSWIATFDNGATTEELRFLAAAYQAQGDTTHLRAFLKGLDYVLAAQFPNGCWPQVYPLEGSYHDAATFNDNAVVNVLAVLTAAARGDWSFVPPATRSRAGAAVQHGLTCILAAQVKVRGQLTTWAQQNDPLTLLPVPARAYEPAALDGGYESAGLMDYLMGLSAPGADAVTAVRAAAAWFKQNAIYDYIWMNGQLTPSKGAGPLWARFYELGTDRPIFGDRDGSVHYDVSEISEERRLGYAWYGNVAAGTLKRFDSWATTH